MFNYFREAIIVKSHELSGVIERHCVSMEFIIHSDESDADQFQDDYGKLIRRIDGCLDTDALGKQFGRADVYDNAKLNFCQQLTDSRLER